MKLYREVLIESVEQAEALPPGTQRLQDGREGLAVGFTALVPIEAEEETIRKTGYVNEDGYLVHSRFSDDPVHVATKTYFMSPWEEE